MRLEWWVRRFLNRVIVDAIELSVALGSSKHPAARAMITAMKTVVEHIKKSDRAKVRGAAML